MLCKSCFIVFFVRINNSLINRFFGQIPGQIVLGLFKLTSLGSVNSEKTSDNLSRNLTSKPVNKIIVLCLIWVVVLAGVIVWRYVIRNLIVLV